MAPRLPEAFEQFEQRARSALSGGASEVRFGRHHHSHAIVTEPDGSFAVRRLEYTQAERDAYFAAHRMFMPESAEQISKPRTVVATTRTLDEVLQIVKRSWPW